MKSSFVHPTSDAPSLKLRPLRPNTDAEADVDEALEDSFPASDPPPWAPTTVGDPWRPEKRSEPASGSRLVRLRDVARKCSLLAAGVEQGLRVPYDMWNPDGVVRRRGAMIEYVEWGEARTARVMPCLLEDVHPGERVLVRARPTETAGEAEPLDESQDGEEMWWLCEVMESSEVR